MTSRNRSNFPARRSRQWGITNVSTSLTVASFAGKSVIDLSAALEANLGLTLNNVTASAIRIKLIISFLTGGTLGEGGAGAYGIMWASNTAITAGVASIPDPIADDADWMAHGKFTIFVEQTHAHIPRGGIQMISNDSMRKQRENNSSLVLVTEASLAVHGMGLGIGGRVLFLLP